MYPAPASFARIFQRAQIVNLLQTGSLWMMAALHILALVSLLLVLGSLSPANAAEPPPVCTGANLLDELKAENPTAYADVLAKAEKIPNGEGIFWKIDKEGAAPSYLLGTMHVTDPRVMKMPAGAKEALARAATVVVESDEVLDEKKAMAALQANPALILFTDDSSLSSHLGGEDLQILKSGIESRGLPYPAVSQMRPWMLMGLIGLPACELARKAANVPFLDKEIAQQAKAAGKKVKGLETLEEQANAINAIPLDLQLKSLVEAVRLGSEMNDVFFTMTELYLSGEIGTLQPLLRIIAPDGTDDQSGYAEFDKLVVTRRNHLMAERAGPILEKGDAFIAVGAAHLPGEEGLVELLRQQGFTVTRVE